MCGGGGCADATVNTSIGDLNALKVRVAKCLEYFVQRISTKNLFCFAKQVTIKFNKINLKRLNIVVIFVVLYL